MRLELGKWKGKNGTALSYEDGNEFNRMMTICSPLYPYQVTSAEKLAMKLGLSNFVFQMDIM